MLDGGGGAGNDGAEEGFDGLPALLYGVNVALWRAALIARSYIDSTIEG